MPIKPSAAEPAACNASREAVHAALAAMGRDEATRQEMLSAILRVEQHMGHPNRLVRDSMTGPLVDALHADVPEVVRVLSCGLTMHMRSGSRIAREFIMAQAEKPDHVWEPQTTRLLVHLSRSARHVIVGGAFIGDHAMLIAQAIKANGGVCHAFEPDAAALAMLRRNAECNHMTNLRIRREALWHASGRTLTLDGADALTRTIEGEAVAEHSAACTTITIDDYARANCPEGVQLIMLDLEGAEHSALQGAVDVLTRSASMSPTVVFETHSLFSDWSNGLAESQPAGLLRETGYVLFAIRDAHANLPMGDRPIELIPIDRVVTDGPPHGFNMLAVRNDSIVAGAPFRVVSDVSPKLLPHKDSRLHGPIGGW